jgi:hypothetical protein
MRVFRICGYPLLLAPLLGIVGCGGPAYVKKGPEEQTNKVKVSGCLAHPDTVLVSKGDTLTWTIDPPDGHDYVVKFQGRKPISLSTVPIGQGQKVNGDFWCNYGGWASTSLCVYSYDLIQDPGTRSAQTCHDPGVHVH